MNSDVGKFSKALCSAVVIVIGAGGVLLAVLWAVLAIASSMGWSGRSDLQIAAIIVLLLLFPVLLALTLTVRAIHALKNGRMLVSVALAFGSLLCAPIAWTLLALGLFAP